MEDFEASSLHLRPCSLEDYFNIAAENGVYDLIEGILVLKEMGDQEHDRGAVFWAMTFNNEKPEEEKRVAMFTLSVEISSNSSWNSNNNVSGKPAILRPDMAIGKLPSAKERRTLPKETQDIMFPKGYPPELRISTTSCDPRKDLNIKPKMYLARPRRETRSHVTPRQKRKRKRSIPQNTEGLKRRRGNRNNTNIE